MAMNEMRAIALMKALARMAPEERRQMLAALPPPAFRAVAEAWFWQAHGGQREPRGDWRVWLMLAGRGFGKTRAAAEWLWARVREAPGAQIALVGATLGEVERVMVLGPSGLVGTAGSAPPPVWNSARRTLSFACGAKAFAYSAERPEALRGPEHHFAWCDEIAKWPGPARSGQSRGEAAWDNLMLGLRLGPKARAVVTTTPRPVPLLWRVRAMPGVRETRGATGENRHLPEDFVAAMEAAYQGTRLGRQELLGELIEDVEGSLWPRELIERSRVPIRHPGEIEGRIVVGVDPPASAAGVCGIVVCGAAADGRLQVLEDSSAGGLSPQGWAARAAAAAERWGADRVAAEANNGGDMVESVLRAAAPRLPVRLVHASRGKARRAEPVAALFERGEAKLAGRFPALEDELAGLTAGGLYLGPGASPDRADAMVWAMTELAEPQRVLRARML